MKPLIIVGPTASGKTALALWLAEHFSRVDILVIDSKQVYRHQDIVTGKDLPSKTSARIFGVDLISPDEDWSVAQGITYAESIITKAKDSNRFLIIVGGTPQYLLSVFEQTPTFVIQPDEKLRATLEGQTLTQLQERLQTVDYKRYEQMNNSDKNNPRRLIRAIEVKASEFAGEMTKQLLLISDCNWIGLSPVKETLESKIHSRVLKRIEQGAIEEYTSLENKYPNWTKEAKAAIGYKEIGQFLSGELSKEQLISLWTLHEVQYAKRQMTWWKRERQIVWFDGEDADLKSHVLEHVKDCYNNIHE